MEDTKKKPYSEMTIEELKVLAKKGDAKAQNKLGVCYAKGKGVRKNLNKAMEWYTKAAEQGEMRAQFNLAAHYYLGNGVKQDYVKALEWYHKAAEQGDSWSQNDIAACYYVTIKK